MLCTSAAALGFVVLSFLRMSISGIIYLGIGLFILFVKIKRLGLPPPAWMFHVCLVWVFKFLFYFILFIILFLKIAFFLGYRDITILDSCLDVSRLFDLGLQVFFLGYRYYYIRLDTICFVFFCGWVLLISLVL